MIRLTVDQTVDMLQIVWSNDDPIWVRKRPRDKELTETTPASLATEFNKACQQEWGKMDASRLHIEYYVKSGTRRKGTLQGMLKERLNIR